MSTPAVEFTSSPLLWIQGLNQLERGAITFYLVLGMELCSFPPIVPLFYTACCLIRLKDNFLFCYSRLFSRDTPKTKANVCLTRHLTYDHREEVKSAQNCAFLGRYTVISGSSLPTFRNNLSHLRGPLEMGAAFCPERSVRNHHHSLSNNSEECGSHLVLGGSLES